MFPPPLTRASNGSRDGRSSQDVTPRNRLSRRMSGQSDALSHQSTTRSDSKQPIPLNTSTLDVVDFAVARAHELSALRLALRERSGTRRVYQTLSWHARRRTMSHSARRMPHRLRAAHEAQLLKSKAVTPSVRDAPGPAGKRMLRKYRGRARFLKALRRLRVTRAAYLETHIWHAKRFAMRQLHSFKVAATCRDRGVRSAFRALTRSCVAHDESYLRVAQIVASDSSSVVAVFRRATTADDALRISTQRARTGERIVRNVVLHSPDSTPAGLSDVLYAPEGTVAWLWLRPEVADDVLSALEDVCAITEGDATASWVADMPGRFRVLGPRAELVLKAVIHWKDTDDSVMRRGARCEREGIVVSAAFSATALGGPKISQCGKKLDAHVHLWDSETRSELMVRAVRRTRDPMTNIGIPALLLQRGGDCGYYGWDVIVPRGWCMPVWAALMNANGRRAIGIDEVHELQAFSNSGVLFPDEFVDCPSAYANLKVARTQHEQFVARHPIGKRPPLGEGVLAILGRLADDKVTTDRPQKRLRGLNIANDRDKGDEGHEDRGTINEAESHLWRRFSVLRGTLALRSALGVIAGGISSGSGYDNWFVAVAVRTVLRGIPRRDAVISILTSQSNGVAIHETIGVVLSGGYGLDVGIGVGRAIVRVDGLRRAWECAKRSSCKTSPPMSLSPATVRLVRCSARAAVRLKAVPVVFRNVGANSPWRDAVLTVVRG